tara:strand:- start:138 stop:455 length:318 start_codon:yes stop_codon:yes gene_type:complete
MSILRINDTAPNFDANTTHGKISFHDWLSESWGILFSHPKDFTPVCTTELGYMAKIEKEFTKRNCKIIGLSVDPLDDHEKWINTKIHLTTTKNGHSILKKLKALK